MPVGRKRTFPVLDARCIAYFSDRCLIVRRRYEYRKAQTKLVSGTPWQTNVQTYPLSRRRCQWRCPASKQWRSISMQYDFSIYFADLGTPSQRGLNEHSNGLFREFGLPKKKDYNQVDQEFVCELYKKYLENH
ncbi:IS30 family transposase [Shouchella clausii KSM-K16]|uniref:IS30 family transposase n=1 Tax=Shouchella clausii (strain KSM-K16) TaxID=66692 RepID=Q5WBN1_SHOC1|nr:IS30 family transposase [Shouchella clausii KSM-K16]